MAESNSQSEFIRRLPKAELHLHLEGTVTPETLVELSRRHDSVTLTLDKSFSIYDYKNFSEFLMAFKAVTERLRTPEDYELIAWRMFERLAAQGIVHAEIYVAVGVVYYWAKIEFEPLFAGLESARIRAEQKLGITAYWIFDAVRHFGVEAAVGSGAKLTVGAGLLLRGGVWLLRSVDKLWKREGNDETKSENRRFLRPMPRNARWCS